jgi:hypothetical protein
LKLKCDEPLSNVAFKFNLRHYTWARNKAALDGFLRSPDAVAADGLSAAGAPREVLRGKVETPLYTVYRAAFPANLKQPRG